jgi:hypothetical protein
MLLHVIHCLQRPGQYWYVGISAVDHRLSRPPGNATVAGMSTSLHLTGFRYNIAAAVFFVRRVSRMPHQMLTCSRFRTALLRSHRMYDIKSSESVLSVRVGTSRSSSSDHHAGVRLPLPCFASPLNIDPVPSIMVAWGIVMTLMCLVKSYQSLVVCVKCICISGDGYHNNILAGPEHSSV